MHYTSILSLFGGLIISLPTAYAGFSSSSSTNIAVYWGQNSYGQGTGSLAQQRLSYYCANSQFNIIPIAFLITLTNPSINFANAGDNCTAIAGSNLLSCPQLEADIQTCQNTYGKTILLSVGGATYSEGGFTSTSAAESAAANIWSIFGPSTSSSVPRPFGNAVIDGFDFDFESTVSNMPAFANELRFLMTSSTASTGKQYILTAAPQCPYPDAADGPMLAGAVPFDAVFVQFYNNYCGVQSYTPGSSTQNNFNFATWDNWAKTVSLNPNVKVFLGIPANTGAGAGYQAPGSQLQGVINYCQGYSSFGGVMMWDMSQLYANPGFLGAVAGYLGAPATTTVTSPGGTTTSATTTTMSTVIVSATTTSVRVHVLGPGPNLPSTTGVEQYDQCGGIGYTGSTVCQSPYVCTVIGPYWSQCD